MIIFQIERIVIASMRYLYKIYELNKKKIILKLNIQQKKNCNHK